MRPKLVIVGSANTDMMLKVDRLPAAGETVLGGNFLMTQGGKGANQAVAAARLGAEVTFVARLGRDQLGKAALEAYQREGINTNHIVWDDQAATGVALIMVNKVGENIIAVAPGANGCLSPADVLAAETAIMAADGMLLQLETPLETVEAAINLARKYKVRVILNPAPAVSLSLELLNKIDVLTPNMVEAMELAGGDMSHNAKEAADLLISKLEIKHLIITMGKDGALIAGNQNEIIPAYPVQPVDTTGAGDAFNGAVAVALARGDELINAVKFANAVAALSTTHFGAQLSMPSLDEVNSFLDQDLMKKTGNI